MKTSENGLEIIRRHEGCRLKAYLCPAGVWTIGYGHTGKEVGPEMVICRKQADVLLQADVQMVEEAINREGVYINQNQFDALVSFVYNVGVTAFRTSTLLKMIRINSRSLNIRTEFDRWNKAKGSTLPGLVLRRNDEKRLYFKDDN